MQGGSETRARLFLFAVDGIIGKATNTYSYHIVGDMVVIGTDRVMTISGNTLIYDDMGVVLYKWN